MDYQVRRAHPFELRAAFALMPEVAAAGVAPEAVFVASDPGSRALLGAAAFSTVPHETRCSGVRGMVFVQPSQRRRGIGGALLNALAAELSRWEIPYLHSWTGYAPGEQADFLRAKGFAPLRPVRHFHVDIAIADTECSRLLARMAPRIPSTVTVGALSDASAGEAAELYARHFGMSPEAAAHRVRDALTGAAHDLCFALRDQGGLLGFILWKAPEGEPPAVDLWIVAPAFRSGWPAMLLLQSSVRRCRERGVTHARFHCNDDARATLHVARAIQAQCLREEWTYVLDVARRGQ